jgi:hypothetical protein
MPKSISVVVDKSHLVTIGEKLYSQRIDFIRELVNNAYDADATLVTVTTSRNRITIEDNGKGMTQKNLEQYFTIGSTEKQSNPYSTKYQRRRIGEFGIGKFAALAAAEEFELETQRDDFHGQVVFSKVDWFSNKKWQVPLEELPLNPFRVSGTTVILRGLKQAFSSSEIIRIIREKCPLQAKNFKVLLNGVKIDSVHIPGRVIPIEEKTKFGMIRGKIILATQNLPQAGVQILVRGVSIKQELFGLEYSHSYGVSRIAGSVEADFLPITSGRDDFIRDSKEFAYFYTLMQKHLKKALNTLKDLQWQKLNEKASLALKEALKKIGKVLKKHPELIQSQSDIPFGDETLADDFFNQKAMEDGYSVSRPKNVAHYDEDGEEDENEADMMISDNSVKVSSDEDTNDNESEKPKKKEKKKPKLSLAHKTIIRRLRLANLGLICRMEHLGQEELESFSEHGAIYLNMDHPYYRKLEKNETLLVIHICRLVSLEIALKQEENIRDALKLQDRILREIL